MNICTELFLEDIVEVRFYKRQGYPMAATPNIPNIYSAEVTMPVPAVVLAIAPDESITGAVYAALTSSPTVKVSNKLSRDGDIYTHDVSCSIDNNHDAVRNAIAKIAHSDTYLIYKKADGTMFMTYTCPNAGSLTTEDNAGSNRTLTVKASMKSLSGLISVTFPTTTP